MRKREGEGGREREEEEGYEVQATAQREHIWSHHGGEDKLSAVTNRIHQRQALGGWLAVGAYVTD